MTNDLMQRLRTSEYHASAYGHALCTDAAAEIERLQARVAKLESALRHAIKEADGWCDDSRGVPASGLDWARSLVDIEEAGR